MLTTKQIELVRSSFEAVAARAGEFAAAFYERLFGLQPALRLLFPDEMEAQKKKLIEMLDAAVRLLDAPERLVPVLEESGRRHLLYGVRERDYETLGAALLETIARTPGLAFDAETEAAWKRVYELMSDAMRRGARGLQNAGDEAIERLAAAVQPPCRNLREKSDRAI